MAQMHGGTHFHSICTVSIPFGTKMVLAALLRKSLASCNLNVLVANGSGMQVVKLSSIAVLQFLVWQCYPTQIDLHTTIRLMTSFPGPPE